MLRMGFAHVEMRSRKVFPKGMGKTGGWAAYIASWQPLTRRDVFDCVLGGCGVCPVRETQQGFLRKRLERKRFQVRPCLARGLWAV